MKYWFNSAFSFIISGVIYLLGGWDISIQVLITFMIIDYITGMISAIKNHQLSSKIGSFGLIKKCLMLTIVAVGVEVDKLLGQSGVFRSIVIYFYVSNEGISILENLIECDVRVPEKLKEILKQIQDKEN